ncbi:beta-microseminoprotein [Alligator mississippiensis]|uniref:Beta-microseminoprotein n=1 Tax=Alligator mississippiensis TaxID=8496 RepID=A0A151MKU5_ALLMI|nr:beta-microseminoprotein [Alligator mississippiensis]KYO25154.1 beta-microseminoprotein [Alligator mississippiensis]
MKHFLVCIFPLVLSVSLCNAACFIQSMEPGVPGCVDDQGKLHAFNTNWKTDNCLDCSCSEHGMDCCDIGGRPAGYDEEKCESIFNKDTCSYTVVEKNNPSKECEVHAWVG